MTDSENNKKQNSPWMDGWIVVLLYFLVHSWTRWVSPNGFALFYRHNNNHSKGRPFWCDLVVFLLLDRWHGCSTFLASAFGLSSFKCLDLLADFMMLAVFGNKYGRSWLVEMPRRRRHRTVIIDLLLFVELVFWHAILAYVLGIQVPGLFSAEISCRSQALQYSLATATTVGYGTYAPDHLFSVLQASIESISALLLVAGVVSVVFSLNTSDNEHIANRIVPAQSDEYGLCVPWEKKWGWRLRYFLPVAIPVVFITLACTFMPAVVSLAKASTP